MKRLIRSFLCLALITGTLAGCSSEQPKATGEQPQTPATASQGHDGHMGGQSMEEQMRAGNQLSADYSSTLTTATPPEANKPTTLTLSLTDKSGGLPIRNLQQVHEKILHLIVVSKDLSVFQHLHPELVGPGKLEVQTTLPQEGEYILYSQFSTPEKGEQTVRNSLQVGKASSQDARLVPDADKVKSSNGYTFKLTDHPEKAGEMAMPTVAIEKNGKPVDTIENYLGAGGHAVIISEDGDSFLHVHPMTESKDGKYKSPIAFHTMIPKPGNYKLWTQFQVDGKVQTVDFTFRAI
jgi:hypothetical protein